MRGPDHLEDDCRRGGRYLELSREYAAAALALATSHERDNVGRAFFAIASHALELSFKAFLRARGSSEEHLMMFNHNLERSLSSCLTKGMVPEDRELLVLIDALGRHHAAQSFRYPGWNVDLDRLPSPAHVARILASHLKQTEVTLARSPSAMPPRLNPADRSPSRAPREGP